MGIVRDATGIQQNAIEVYRSSTESQRHPTGIRRMLRNLEKPKEKQPFERIRNSGERTRNPDSFKTLLNQWKINDSELRDRDAVESSHGPASKTLENLRKNSHLKESGIPAKESGIPDSFKTL